MDSLLLGNLELLGITTNPEYRLGQGIDLGAPEPDQATLAATLLDGDLVSGDRTKNRTINLTVRVFANVPSPATTAQIRAALSLYCDTLLAAINSKTFTLQWTPDGGLPVVFDCFRGRGQRQRTIVTDNQGVTLVSFTCQAMPFGRSPVAQSISAAASLQIDSFDTAPTGATLDTVTKYEGTGSAKVTLTGTSGTYVTPAPITRSYAAKNLSAYSGLSLRHTEGGFNTRGRSITITITLGSAAGSTRYATTTSVSGFGLFGLASVPLTSGVVVTGTGVDLTAVTSESITLSIAASATPVVNIDDLRATAGSSALISTALGAVMSMPAIIGSARAPVSLALSGTTMATAMLHSPPSAADPNAAILMANAVGASPANTTATVAAASSGYAGTYAIWLGTSAAPSGANTVTVTVTQKEGATTVATQTITLTYTAPLITGRLVPVGNISLPLRATPTDNTATNYTFNVNHTAGTDLYSDVILADTRGETVVTVPPSAVSAIYVDEPAPTQTAPTPYASATDRTAAYGIVDGCYITGGPVMFDPGTSALLTWGSAAAPAVTATYYPRWMDERVA